MTRRDRFVWWFVRLFTSSGYFTDEERELRRVKQRQDNIDLRLRWIRYQADQLSRMEREHKKLLDEHENGDIE